MTALNASSLNDFRIVSIPFTGNAMETLKSEPKSSNWPVVYLLNGKQGAQNKLYVGETSNFRTRLKQHKDNPARSYASSVRIIFDPHYTKSAVLDIEQSLIRLFSADGQFVLDNRNAGQSASHNYYQRELYQLKLPLIWDRLRSLRLAANSYETLTNSTLYTYSPFTNLTEEQHEACRKALENFVTSLETGQRGTQVITGTAGTGKTIVAINLMRIVAEVNAKPLDSVRSPDWDDANDTSMAGLQHRLRRHIEQHGPLSIGYVVYMASLRKTIKQVFKHSQKSTALSPRMVLGPFDLFKKPFEQTVFDLLIVDETHRLPRYKNLLPGTYNRYQGICDALGLDYAATSTLDWIVRKSRFQVLFYDAAQSVRPSDVTPPQFARALDVDGNTVYDTLELTVQMRCAGGTNYIEHIGDILAGTADTVKRFADFDFRLFDNVDVMVKRIRHLDGVNGMICRTVAGYAWEWKTKGKTLEEIRRENLYDIAIGDYRYVWNTTAEGWILSPNAENEIGCVHTTQGFDLSYVGVVFGPEIDYVNGAIVVDGNRLKDSNTKRGADETLHDYIVNTYKVLLSRGIRGCYVYACNEGLRRYLRGCIPAANADK